MLVFIAGASTTRPGERQIDGGQEIVGQAVRETRQQIGGGRRDHQQVVVLRDGDVLDGARKRVLRSCRKQTGR